MQSFGIATPEIPRDLNRGQAGLQEGPGWARHLDDGILMNTAEEDDLNTDLNATKEPLDANSPPAGEAPERDVMQ